MKVEEIQANLTKKAQEISKEFNQAPVVIVVGGSSASNIPQCTTGHANLCQSREERLRDLLGILEAAKQVESKRHLLG